MGTSDPEPSLIVHSAQHTRLKLDTVALFSLLTHEIYVTIPFDEPLLFWNGLQPSAGYLGVEVE